jgi:hypothetical protein
MRRYWQRYQRAVQGLAVRIPLWLTDLLSLLVVMLSVWLFWSGRPADLLVFPAILLCWLLTLRFAVLLFRSPLPAPQGNGWWARWRHQLRRGWRQVLLLVFLLLCLLMLAFSLKFAGVILRALSA